MSQQKPMTGAQTVVAESLRQAARKDPTVFAGLMLRQKLPTIHKRLHRHRLSHPDCFIILHRGCGKTVEVGIGEMHAIARTGIERPDLPLPRLKVIVSNDGEAEKTGRFLRDMAETDVWKWVFPEIVPDPDMWNIASFRLRNANAQGSIGQRDATVESRTIMGRAGGRWDRIWFDDICDLQTSILKPTMRDQVKMAVENTWMPMRDKASHHKTTSVRTATPWHNDDQVAVWERQHKEDGSLMREPVVNFVSPWPEVFTEEYLREERRLRGPMAFARAYELIPVDTEMLIFRPDWILSRLWRTMPEMTRELSERWVALDFAFTEKRLSKPDPDWSVAMFARIDRKRHVWVQEMIRMRGDFPAFKKAVLEGIRRHGTRRGIGEAVAGQIGLVQQISQDTGIPFIPLPRFKDKHYRGTECQAQVEAGHLRLRAGSDPGQPSSDQVIAFEEMCAFPAGAFDDTCDVIFDLLQQARSVPPEKGAPPISSIRTDFRKMDISLPGAGDANIGIA